MFLKVEFTNRYILEKAFRISSLPPGFHVDAPRLMRGCPPFWQIRVKNNNKYSFKKLLHLFERTSILAPVRTGKDEMALHE
jgi:hypothetical protein